MRLPRWLRWRSRSELDDEIRSHIEMEVQANLDRGLPVEEARRAANLRFGNAMVVKERSRDGDPLSWLEILFKDTRYVLRGLGRAPVFTLAALVTPALGIGAALAFAGGGLARTLVFGIEPRSMAIVAAACLLLALVSAAACFLPAFRAAQIDPHEALRAE